MALILNIETSTEICSVAFFDGEKLIGHRESSEEKAHASLLTVFINNIAAENNIDFARLDAVAVSKGPGSYTGLRIGVSVAKGICYAINKPLIAISTLQAMASEASETAKTIIQGIDYQNAWFCPMIDARRMEVYTALFDHKNNEIRETKAEIIDENSFTDILDSRKLILFGNGATKCKPAIKHPNALFIDGIKAGALSMASLSEEAFLSKNFVNTAYFEPFYLKDFVATVSKKNVFGF